MSIRNLLLTSLATLVLGFGAGLASAQLPPDPGGDGETFQVTVEYNCCGQVDIDYNNFFSNPGSQQITATAAGSTTI